MSCVKRHNQYVFFSSDEKTQDDCVVNIGIPFSSIQDENVEKLYFGGKNLSLTVTIDSVSVNKGVDDAVIDAPNKLRFS